MAALDSASKDLAEGKGFEELNTLNEEWAQLPPDTLARLQKAADDNPDCKDVSFAE